MGPDLNLVKPVDGPLWHIVHNTCDSQFELGAGVCSRRFLFEVSNL